MRVDYDQIAATYDHHRSGGGPGLDALAAAARSCGGGRFLELGAGTGNNTRALLERVPGCVVALEPSREMAAQGRAKGLDARWVRGVGERLPLADGAFDFVYGAYMLHYIRDLAALFGECRRVLRPGGRAAFITVPTDFIEEHPLRGYFPSIPRVDLARFQPLDAVADAMVAAGFRDVTVTVETSPPHPVDAAYVRKVEGRIISTFELLPPGEFEAGLARLKADLARGTLDVAVHRAAATVSGRREAVETP